MQVKEKDVVIGPAKDGGYYLLGMNVFVPGLFDNIEWSTGNVCQQTVTHVKALNYSFYLLQTLNDVDTAEDVNFAY